MGWPIQICPAKVYAGPIWAEQFEPIWVTQYGPTWDIPHGAMFGNPYGPARLKFMWSPYRLYFMGLPTWVTHGTYAGQPIQAYPAKTYLGPTNSCYLDPDVVSWSEHDVQKTFTFNQITTNTRRHILVKTQRQENFHFQSNHNQISTSHFSQNMTSKKLSFSIKS